MGEKQRKMVAADIGLRECRYDMPWAGRCRRPTTHESGICEDHRGEKCVVCGGQSTHGCSYAGQFVCGAPLCDDCTDDTTPGPFGSWGFLNHIHKRKADRPPQRMMAADIGAAP